MGERAAFADAVKSTAKTDPAMAQSILNEGYTYGRSVNGRARTYKSGPIRGSIGSIYDTFGNATGEYEINGLNRGGKVPAMLTGGEYVIGRESAQKYGPQVMESINNGHFTGFNHGGSVGGSTSATTNESTKNDVNITVNVTGGGVVSESVDSSGSGIGDPKEFGKRIKAAVLDVIQQQKRVGGMLRS